MTTGTITVNNNSLGSALSQFMLSDDITPGDDPSYQVCKTIYLFHPLGGKMVDAPIKMAQSQERKIVVPDSPEDRVVEAFTDEWKRMRCDSLIAQTMSVTRTYGVGSLVMGAVNHPSDVPLEPAKYATYELFFNVVDPLNTAGSIVLNQDPNSPDFQKHTAITVAGQAYHRSRCCVMMNEKPVYIAYTQSGFGYVGRSVFQRAFFPLKTFVQSMITDDMVTTKAGLLIAKLQQPGSIADRLMGGFMALKRSMLAGAATGNVLSISAGSTSSNAEDVTTLNMMNVDGAGGWARTNCIKNVATAADMPAIILENETLSEGSGLGAEGSEDAKAVGQYVNHVRTDMAALYDFLDPIVMRRAWNPEFYKTIQTLYPDQWAKVDYNTAFYRWSNTFRATWPSYLEEPESEKVKVADVKLKAIVAVVEVLLPAMDPENKARLFDWLADNLNSDEVMFSSPLILDSEALAQWTPPVLGAEGGPKEPGEPKPFASADSAGGRAVARWRAG